MTKPVKASFVAIGRQLRDSYSQSAALPLPAGLKDLVARLVVLESGTRSNQRSSEVLQPAILRAGPRLS